MLVVMELIIFIILEVHANDPTPLSSALTPLPASIYPFHLDNEDMNYIHRCLESVLKLCEERFMMEYCIAKNLLGCLFKDPMHPKNYPTGFYKLLDKCYDNCLFTSQRIGIHHAPCILSLILLLVTIDLRL